MINTTLGTVAKALIINEKNEALILEVGEYKERPDKSFTPDLPGGRVDPGESERDAVVREIREEAGFDVEGDKLQLAYTETTFFEAEQKSVAMLVYLAFIDHTPDVKISWEHASYEWVPVKNIMQDVALRPFYKRAVEYCFSHKLIG